MIRAFIDSKIFRRRGIAGLTVILCIGFLVQFQNCGELGGCGINCVAQAPSSCVPGTPGCNTDGGNPSLLRVNVTSAQNIGGVRTLTVSSDDTSLSVDGTCDKGGFARARILWSLKLGATVVKSGRDAQCNETDGDGQFQVQITGLDLKPAPKDFSLEVTIAGLDKYDNEYVGSQKSTVKVESRNVLLRPLFHPEACNATCSGQPWMYAGLRYFYIFNSNGATSYNVGAGGVTPQLRGFCQRRPGGPAVEVRIKIDEVGLPNNGTALAIDQPVPCQAYTKTTRPSGVNAAYDGFFELPAGITVNYDTTRVSWHGRLYATTVDPINDQVEITSRTLQHIETQFRFRPGDGSGRNWTVPLARSSLRRWKHFATFSDVADSDQLQQEAKELVTSRAGAGGFQSLRTYVIQKYMGLRENYTGAAGMPMAFIDVTGISAATLQQTNNFLGLMRAVAIKQRACDTAIGGDINTVPNFSASGGVLTDPNDPEYQMARLSICLVYWFYHGYLARSNTDNWLGWVARDGMFHEPDGTYCYTKAPGFVESWKDSNGGGDGAPCDYMRSDFLNHIKAMRTKYLGFRRLDDLTNPTQTAKFYATVAQRFLNWLGGGLCESSGANPQEYIGEHTRALLNGALPVSYDGFKYGAIQAGLFPLEDNQLNAPFRTYNRPNDASCFSSGEESWQNTAY